MICRQFLFFFPVILTFVLSQCNQTGKRGPESVPEYNPFITAYTSGLISAESPIKIRFAENILDTVVPDTPLDRSVIYFSPEIEGNLYYVNNRTLEFRPAEKFNPGTTYTAKVKLGRLFPGLKENNVFEFSFQTISQHIKITVDGFRPYNDYKPEKNFLTGAIFTADAADPSAAEAIIQANQRDRKLLIRWDHNQDGKQHGFVIDSVLRSDIEETVIISFDGAPVQSDQSGEEIFKVPPLGSFKVISHKVVQYPEQHVIISFSDPIRKNQVLDGLIRLGTDADLKFHVDGNNVLAYPEIRQTGNVNLYIEPGIKNTGGKSMGTGTTLPVMFEDIKPAVQLLGRGVIIPQSGRVMFPFKAVNLKAVDVKVIKIYEDNVAQFLQVNSLSGSQELKRAGRLILKKRIDLFTEKPINYGEWNTFSINLTDLVKTEPGAIYRIEIGFRQAYSLYPCGEMVHEGEGMEMVEDNYDDTEDSELSYWDSYESYYSSYDYSYDYYYYEGYEWEDREDPCKEAYFGNRRSVARNVLSSNLGIIAKNGSDNKWHITVSDIIKAEPLGNISVKAYNFQNQLLGEESTSSTGRVIFDLDAKPMLVIAENGNMKGYLKLNDGSALSYSMFDVSGTVIKKGLKGFIYGERGVWRPGDSIFISFILDDRANPLPEDHPVIFELKDPRGKIVEKLVQQDNGSGFFAFHTKTGPDSPTGQYSVYARIGGVTFSKQINIETIKPNRLKIDLEFDGDTLYPAEGPVTGTIFSRWLTGAAAGNLKAEIEVLLRPARTAFKGYENYMFEDPAKELNMYPVAVFSGNLDETGKAAISRELEIWGEAPGMLNAVFTSRVFERSGDFSIDQQIIPCSPYASYVGIKTPSGDKRGMLLTDTLHKIDVVTLDMHGNPVTRVGLEVTIYKLDWRWWWESSSESLASYIGSNYQAEVYSSRISTRNGKGFFQFKIEYPEWGRYLIQVKDLKGGHSTGKIVYIDWPGWAGRDRNKDPETASILSFSADKSKYNVGETVTVTIPSSENGRIFLSIENGSGVLKQEWIDPTGTETRYSFKVSSEMTPNIYLYATLLQPHLNTENDLPIRMFGVIPLLVEDPSTRLVPLLEMPDELSPNSMVTIRVSEATQKKMTYTIAMVDEGLLDLTRFRTPDPWSSFYAREALGVKTWDMFEDVLGAFGGRIDGIYNIGGDMEGISPGGAKEANRFPPMVRFLGPFTLDQKSNSHTVRIPNYIGSVRTMIIAGQGGAYGSTEKTTPVKQPLMVLATLPRVLGPGEEVNLPVNVFVMDDKISRVKVEISTNEMLISQETTKELAFSGTGDRIVNFRLRTPLLTGPGKVHVKVSAGRENAEYNIELEIRPSNPPVTNYMTYTIDPGSSVNETVRYVGMPGTNDLLMEVSNIPPIDFGRRLKYLLQYPHGCIEQTVSSAFPQLFLADVVSVDEPVIRKTESNIKAAIKKLSSFQLSDGSFSYWPGRTEVSEWGTSYAGHFLIEASNKGYDIPPVILSNWKKYQRKAARRWSLTGKSDRFEINQQQLMQAYRLFTLALGGDPELGSMNRLREIPDLVPEARWRLAAAYALAGQNESAMTLVSNLTTQVDEYNDSRYSFGSATRDRAMILESMVLLDMRNAAVPLLEMVAKSLSGQRWMSTQTTAYSLIAISKFTGGNTSGGNLKFEYKFNEGAIKKAETGLSLAQITLLPGTESSGQIMVNNNSEKIIYLRIINNGVPPPGNEETISSNLNVTADYFDMDGKRLDITRLVQGTDFRVVLTVRNPGVLGYYDNIALISMFPPGWEIHNERLFNTTGEIQSFTYQDIRDDRVMTYFGLSPRETKKVTIRLNAAYAGRFYMPSIKAEEMYKNDIQVLIPGKWIEVKAIE